MSRGRSYTIDSGLVTLASTSQTPLLAGNAGAAVTVDVTAIRAGIYSGASVAYTANATVQLYLARAANTPVGGTGVTARPNNIQDIAANSAWTIGTWSTTPTFGSILWGAVVPFSAGANWGEVFDRDFERRLGGAGSSAWWAIFATCSTAGTATQFSIEVDFIE